MMRIIRLLIDCLLGSVSPGYRACSFSSLPLPRRSRGSRSLAKPSWRLRARARTDDFRVKGSEASHLRVHTRPLINCFTCSDSQLSQPPDSVMILLSSAFVSCCGCSCVINPPLLSSAAEISYQVVTRFTKKCAELHREIICGAKSLSLNSGNRKKGSS